MAPRRVFVTGTDTGVGKTVLTALLTAHLRQAGVPVFALKPFCSGRRDDAELLHSLQRDCLKLEEINPFYFAEPLAPLESARRQHRSVQPQDVLRHIRGLERKLTRSAAQPYAVSSGRVPILLLEGAGGLLVPLCRRLSVLDLIVRLRCEVLIVAANRLGTINHSLLTLRALRQAGIRRVQLVLMDQPASDFSSGSNPRLLSELIAPARLYRMPCLRPAPDSARAVEQHAAGLQKVLAGILPPQRRRFSPRR